MNSELIITLLNLLKSDNCKQSLLDKLLELGLTLMEIDEISDLIDSVMEVNLSEEEVNDAVASEESNSSESMDSSVKSSRSKEKFSLWDLLLLCLELFNAEVSVSIVEPELSESKFTAPVDIQDADYTVIEDYPATYGYIDIIKNWLKINQDTHHVEMVHASKTQIKIDKEGNVLLYITGNLKQIIEGDYSLEVKGNHDVRVTGKKYDHVVGDLVENYDSEKEEVVGGNVTETYGGNHNTTVSGDRIEVAATIHHN